MSFVQILNWKVIVDKISEASNAIYVSLPGVNEELAELLVSIKKDSRIVIKVCLDNCEDVIRNGFGEARGIDKLIEHNIDIKECMGNRVSFIIIDESGYILFPESRIFAAEPSGPNAIELDPFTTARLIAYYFPADNGIEKEQLQKRFENGLEIQKQLLSQIDSEVTEQKATPVTQNFKIESHLKTKDSLNKVPPIEPDLQRRIKTYTAKVQFVELRFTGINLNGTTIKIPKDVLPKDSSDLKNLLFTKAKLFQNRVNNSGLNILDTLKQRVDKLREDYLKPITCREGKSLIQVERKESFKAELEDIRKSMNGINKSMPEILEQAKFDTKKLIRKELMNYYGSHIPEHIIRISSTVLKESLLKEYVDNLVGKIHFPDTDKLLDRISLNDYYYDLTFQDFSDEKLIDELKKKEIMKTEDIQGIVEMKNAFEEKK